MGVKETQCTRCGHRLVCLFKNTYLDMVESLDKLPLGDCFELDIRCKHYADPSLKPKIGGLSCSNES